LGTEMNEPAKKVAESVILLVAARVSMVLALPTIGVLFSLYSGWQEEKLGHIRDQIEAVQVTAKAAEERTVNVSNRLVAVETRQTKEAADGERFQRETLARLDRMQDALIQLSNSVSALTATVKSLAERDERRNRD
jgi:hypothetical protein